MLEIPQFMLSQAATAKMRVYPPVWFPEQCEIASTLLWNQGQHPPNSFAKNSLAIDPRGFYSQEAGYPFTEGTSPTTLISAGVHEIFFGAPRLAKIDHPHPLVIDQAKGDHLIFIAEGIYGTDANSPTGTRPDFALAPYVTLHFLSDDDVFDLAAFGPEVQLAMEGVYFPAYGDKVIRDHSIPTHQIVSVGDAKLVTDVYPTGAASSIKLSGDGWMEFRDRLYGFDWPTGQDFEIELMMKTSNVSLDNGNGRCLYSAGPNSDNALFIMRNDGKMGWGTIGTPNTLLGTSNCADNAWHKVKVKRTSSTAKLYVDDVEEASATDTKHYLVSDRVMIGKRNGAWGRWDGYLANYRVTKPF
jgi:hypothetical protein